MGQLRDKRIDIIRAWIDPSNPTPIPDLDYDQIYPISVFEAIKKNKNDNAPSLEDELDAISRLINTKQDIISGGASGRLMTWTGVDGSIGETEILKTISDDPASRSQIKVPSERAVGLQLDLKADASHLNRHINDLNIHITEDERSEWNSMTPKDTFDEHAENEDIHVTSEDKENWNAKADQSSLEDHLNDSNNPHNVTAHQVGTYGRQEVDDMFASIRSSFFNYKNIKYDERTGEAELVEYSEDNWNPNYVLAYSDNLPEVTDQSLTYFAIKPVTDYTSHESSEVIIYMKKPGSDWAEVGSQELEPGDLVIRYPDTTMCAWVNGRFIMILSGSSADSPEGSNALWRPVIDADGNLGFTKSYETAPPDVVNIKGPAGYTPIKGVDYFDGANGLGVPSGGSKGDILMKPSAEDYDTEWKSLAEAIGELIDDQGQLAISVKWGAITEKPEMHHELGDDDDGFISQKAVSDNINDIIENINDIKDVIGGSGGVGGLTQLVNDHISDYNNPHRLSPATIGAVSTETFQNHSTATNNPHGVTAAQIGLGNVNNTSDADKPVSIATQRVIDQINEAIADIMHTIGDGNLISSVDWDNNSCTLIFTFRNGDEMDVVIPIIDIFNGLYFDESTKEFVFILPDGSEKRISIGSLVTIYTGSTSTNAKTVVSDGIITVTVLPNSITGDELVANINLRGEPTTSTQPVSNKSTKIATTEFVKNQVVDNVNSSDVDRPLSANMGKWLNANKTSVNDVLQLIADTPLTNIVDNLQSTDAYAALSANMGHELNLTKAPTVHTSPSGSTFGRATVNLYGHARSATTDPLMDGEVSIGTDDGYFARSDHRHPTDTSRAPLTFADGASLLGDPRSVTPGDEANSNEIATCEWVLAHGINDDYFESIDEETARTKVRDAYDDMIAEMNTEEEG